MIDYRRNRNMSCEHFNACMADLIAAGEDIFAHPHVRKCKLHRAFLHELETIASAARQMFPEVDPSETVWDGIEAEMAREPDPIVSDPFPGYRMVFAIRVIEHGSPPSLDRSSLNRKTPFELQIFGGPRAFPEGRGRR